MVSLYPSPRDNTATFVGISRIRRSWFIVGAPTKWRLEANNPFIYAIVTNFRCLLGTGGLRRPPIPLLRVGGSRSGVDGGAAEEGGRREDWVA